MFDLNVHDLATITHTHCLQPIAVCSAGKYIHTVGRRPRRESAAVYFVFDTTTHQVIAGRRRRRRRRRRMLMQFLSLLLLVHETLHPIAQLVRLRRRHHLQDIRCGRPCWWRRLRRNRRRRRRRRQRTVLLLRIHGGRFAEFVAAETALELIDDGDRRARARRAGRVEELQIEFVGSVEVHLGQHHIVGVVDEMTHVVVVVVPLEVVVVVSGGQQRMVVQVLQMMRHFIVDRHMVSMMGAMVLIVVWMMLVISIEHHSGCRTAGGAARRPRRDVFDFH